MGIKILGTSDDVTTCECCGKSNLKKTVAVSVDDGVAVYYGTTCAARAFGRAAAEIRKDAKRADDEARRAEMNRKSAENAARTAAFHAWLAEHGKGATVVEQIQSLGGINAACAAYGFKV